MKNEIKRMRLKVSFNQYLKKKMSEVSTVGVKVATEAGEGKAADLYAGFGSFFLR